MTTSDLAGKPAPHDLLVNVPWLVSAYYAFKPDPAVREQRVAFGTSGHRGSSLKYSFNENHVLAISQAICEYRQAQDIVAGVITCRSDDVVGISNLFVPPGREDLFWRDCVHAVERLFPGLAMVDYEHGDDLLRARAQGFEEIGPLRVWTHS